MNQTNVPPWENFSDNQAGVHVVTGSRRKNEQEGKEENAVERMNQISVTAWKNETMTSGMEGNISEMNGCAQEHLMACKR